MTESNCNQCGMCCHTTVTGKITSCRYLIDLRNGKTACKIYNRRLGTIIARKGDQVSRCNLRVNGTWDYPGCPQNNGRPSFIDHCKEVLKKQEAKENRRRIRNEEFKSK